MNNVDFDYLLREANAGRVTRRAIELAVAELKNPNRKTKPIILFGIIEYDREQSHKAVVEPFLAGPDATVASQARSLLCFIFPLTTDYIPEILSFMRGVAWDEKGHLRRTAIAVAGAYLQLERNRVLLEELVDMATKSLDMPTYLDILTYSQVIEALYKVVTGENYLRTADRPQGQLMSREFGTDLLMSAKARLALMEG